MDAELSLPCGNSGSRNLKLCLTGVQGDEVDLGATQRWSQSYGFGVVLVQGPGWEVFLPLGPGTLL